MTVLEMSDYRQPDPSRKIEMTFIGFPFETPEGDPYRLNYTVITEKPDEVLKVVQENGGLLMSDEESEAAWWLPWPCAAVRIRVQES